MLIIIFNNTINVEILVCEEINLFEEETKSDQENQLKAKRPNRTHKKQQKQSITN